MEALSFVLPIAGVTIVIAIVAVIIIARIPKVVPKRVIVQTVMSIVQDTYQLRHVMYDLVTESFNVYQIHDPAILMHRGQYVDQQINEISYRLTTADTYIDPYREHGGKYLRFYELGHGTTSVLHEVVNSLSDIRGETAHIERVMSDIQRIDAAILQLNTMPLDVHEPQTVDSVTMHLETVIGFITQTRQELARFNYRTASFLRLRALVDDVLEHAERDYTNLRHTIAAGQVDQYRDRALKQPIFASRFDTGNYIAIATSSFTSSPAPEEKYAIELKNAVK